MNTRVVHFEIPCDNPEKVMSFFKETFGWSFKQFGNEQHWLTITGDEKTPSIDEGVMEKRDPNLPVVNSINVDNIDEAVKKVEKAGGKFVVSKMPIPSVGWLAYFSDPDANIHRIYQHDPSSGK